MDAAVCESVGQVLGSAVVRTRPVTGGDINQAYAVTLADGRELFVKTPGRHAGGLTGMFAAEVRGLQWLADAHAVRTPRVLGCGESFLALELIRSASPAPSFDEELGRGLARLYRTAAAVFGLDHPNFIGRLPQTNRAAARWSDFYASERLEPQLRLAKDAGRMSARAERGLQRVLSTLAELVGPPEPPARLHGDLWGGNVIADEHGAPCLVDPAVYGGHREVDLAMMRLFGGFSPHVFAAYGEAYPLAPGSDDRVPLYQLYPLLVHVNLFGGSYLASVESAVSRLG